MKKLLLCATAAAAFAACNNGSSTKTSSTDSTLNNAFSKYQEHFIDALWKENPDWATGVGYHKYDSVLVVPD